MANDAGSEDMEEIAARVAHDLNNLLVVMEMSAYFIARVTPDNQQVQDDVLELRQALDKAKVLTARLHEAAAAGTPTDDADALTLRRRFPLGTTRP
jgi:hypothetical protein